MDLPLAILTDSYKAVHHALYPPSQKLVAYGEFRKSFNNSKDHRFVWYGIRHIVEKYLEKRWTVKEVEKADKFYSTHNVGKTPYPFPKDLFLKFIKENDGYFPIRLQALPEGTVAHTHVPVYQITAEGEYSRLCTFLETLLTHVWYPTTVATLSRRTHELIKNFYDISVDKEMYFTLDSRLHDFGFRGCTCLEQAVLGGTAHLLNFIGSDTLPACYYVQFVLNNGESIGEAIPATEHSIMTSWPTEKDAIDNIINKFGTGFFACVMDSYDYKEALDKILPSISSHKVEKGGFMVIRPDSGDPVETVLMGLRACEKVFGATKNSKGYKVLNGAGVIQGDGINYNIIKNILESVVNEGYSVQNVAFGMGSGLLHKVNRDTMSFATKLCHIVEEDGTTRDVMKKPKTDSGKISLPGILGVKLVNSVPTVYPKEYVSEEEEMLKIVYDCGPIENVWNKSFSKLRGEVDRNWNKLPSHHNPISKELQKKIDGWSH